MKSILMIKKVMLLLIILLSFPVVAVAGTYWASPTGTATWANAQSATPLSGTSCCSLATANSNASAGDVINLREGTYNTQIDPSNSGTSASNMITYQAYNGETVTITDTGAYGYGILLSNNDYIKVSGITIQDVSRWMSIRNYSDYNEIENCSFTDSDGHSVPIYIWGQCAGGTSFTCHSTHNWIHGCTFYNLGWVSDACNDSGSIMYISTRTTGDYESNYNTVEDCTFYWGGHHLLSTFSLYNVVRNNVFHNEGWMTDPGICDKAPSANGKYGNRCIEISDTHGLTAMYNLIEGNRVGHSGCPPDDNGANSLVIDSPGNILRYNYIYNSDGDGLYFKQISGGDSDNNRVYNNTIYHNGYGTENRTDIRRNGISLAEGSTDNVIKNNILYNNKNNDCGSILYGTTCSTYNTFTNNWTTSEGDPLFINPDISDPASKTLPDLSLSSNSGAVNAGTFLTQANGSGNNSTTLIVDDALYFQDGSWGASISNIEADYIAIGTVSNTIQISSINYATNTITLASSITWSDNASIWLYKDSNGRIVLKGTAPDIGAYEYITGVPSSRTLNLTP